MGRYLLSPRARADLDEIWNYTVERWGADQAETYVRSIQSAIEMLAADPRRGQPIPAVRPGYWKYPTGSHVIFFRIIRDGIDVVRILHGRMDFGRHLS